MVTTDVLPILAICIPTYLRTAEVIYSLNKILECEDSRYIIRVSSNEINSQLEEFCKAKSNIVYHQFDQNQGFNRNFLALMNSVTEDFGLIISDEDYFAPEDLKGLLNYLELEESCNRVAYVRTRDNFTLSSLTRMVGMDIPSRILLATNPLIPTYMSSFVFPMQHINNEILEISFNDQYLNYYPHLLLRNYLVGNFSLPFMVLEEARVTRGLESVSRDTAVNYLELSEYVNRINFVLLWSKNHLKMNRVSYIHMSYILAAQLSAGHKEDSFKISFTKERALVISLSDSNRIFDRISSYLMSFLCELALIYSHFVRRSLTLRFLRTH